MKERAFENADFKDGIHPVLQTVHIDGMINYGY
jgi:hypothetical protein